MNDSLKTGEASVPGVFLFDTRSGQTMLADTSSKRKIYKGLAIDKEGQQLAWMAFADSAGSDVKVFILYYKNRLPSAVVSGKKKHHRYFGLNKAKNAPVMTFYKGNHQEPVNQSVPDRYDAGQSGATHAH